MEVDTFYELCFRCFTEMKRKGITTVGEFHYFHHDQYLYDKQVPFCITYIQNRFCI